MSKIICIINNNNLAKHIENQKDFIVLNDAYEFKNTYPVIVLFREGMNSVEWDIRINRFRDKASILITIQLSDSGLYIMPYYKNKVGCPSCFNLFQEKEKFFLETKLKDEKTLTNIIKKILKFESKSTFQYFIHFSNNKEQTLNYIFPHFKCSHCRTLYQHQFEDLNNYNTYQKSIRTLSNNALTSISSKIPLGKYGVFEDVELYYINSVYICRIKLKFTENTYAVGRSFIKEHAINLAILESLERLSLNGNFYEQDLKHDNQYEVVTPLKLLGIEYAGLKGFLDCDLVKGTSITEGKVVNIPKQLILFENTENLSRRGKRKFHSTSSNGTAIGGSYQEAIFFSIVEYLERSNGLASWEKNQPLRKWPFECFKSHKKIMHLLEFFFTQKCDVQIISTNDSKYFSTVWIFLSWENGQLNSLGSGILPQEAVESALIQLFTGFLNFKHTDSSQQIRMKELSDAKKISNMEDHVLYYLHPSKRHYFNFIEEIELQTELQFINRSKEILSNYQLGLSYLLNGIIGEIKNWDGQVFAVDITPNVLKKMKIPLYTVKVYITNTFHFNFGQYRRKKDPHPFL